jgi:heptosyltransferase II
MKPKKILIIRNDHIGDMILTTGIFRELKKEFPNSELTVIVSKANRSMIENNLNVDEILVADHGKKLLKNWKGYPKLWKKIKNKNFDIGIDLRGDFLNIFFLMFLTRVRKRIGLHKGRLSKLFLDYGRIRDIKKHEIQNMFDVVNEGLGINLKNLKPEIFVSNSDRKDLSELIKKNKLKKFICVCPDASHPLRLLPLEEFDKIIKYVRKKYPEYKIIIPGVSERVDFLVKKNPGAISLKFANLKMLYLLFQKAGVVLSLDTGTTPLSWAGDSNLINILLKLSVRTLDHLKPLSKNAVVVWEKDKPLKAEDIMPEVDKFLNKERK